MDSLNEHYLDSLDLTPVQKQKIGLYIENLFKFDRSKRLISAKDKEALVSNHIEDCILAYKSMGKAPHFVDMGSGNGLPGVIFAILDENSRPTLVDNDKKKGEFLKTVAYRLGVNVEVRVESIKDFDLKKVPRGTVFLYRAFSPKELAIEFIKDSQEYKHAFFASEHQEVPLKAKKIIKYSLSSGISRRILLF